LPLADVGPSSSVEGAAFDSYVLEATLKNRVIEVSRLNGKPFVLNCEWIKTVESTPDTVITLTTGEKFMVKESVEEIVRRTTEYQKRLHQEPPRPGQ
jgi:flagellar protein FlbD